MGSFTLHPMDSACRTCGLSMQNVVHDDDEKRERAIRVWAFGTPRTGGQDYYTWAGVVYHPFVASNVPYDPLKPFLKGARPLSEYQRGYQAGFAARAADPRRRA